MMYDVLPKVLGQCQVGETWLFFKMDIALEIKKGNFFHFVPELLGALQPFKTTIPCSI